jgi:hypothetical protein
MTRGKESRFLGRPARSLDTAPTELSQRQMRDVYRIAFGKPKRKRPFRRPKCRWVDNSFWLSIGFSGVLLRAMELVAWAAQERPCSICLLSHLHLPHLPPVWQIRGQEPQMGRARDSCSGSQSLRACGTRSDKCVSRVHSLPMYPQWCLLDTTAQAQALRSWGVSPQIRTLIFHTFHLEADFGIIPFNRPRLFLSYSIYAPWGRSCRSNGGERGMHIGYWCESQKERGHWKGQDVVGWTILKWILDR